MATGRRAKPYLVKVAEGNPGKRKLNPGPTYQGWSPRCPKWLPAEGKKLFKSLSKILLENGLLNEATWPAFTAMCKMYGKLADPDLSPSQTAAMAAQFRGFCVEFGLTPASVQKIPKQKKEVTLAEILGK